MAKQSQKYPTVLILAITLIGSLPFIAMMQYNWLAQLSRAETVRMQSGLERIARHFGNQIEQQLIEAHFLFRILPMQEREQIESSLATQFRQWELRSGHPELVKGLLVADLQNGDALPQLLRFDTSSKLLVPLAGEEIITFLQSSIQEPLEPEHFLDSLSSKTDMFISPAFFSSRFRHLSELDSLAIGMKPIARSQWSQLFIGYDLEYISEVLLPLLVDRHINGSGYSDYNILITSRDDPDNILYSSNAMLTLEDVENPDLVLGVGLPDQQHMARLSSKVGAQMRDIGRDFGGGHKEQDTTIEGSIIQSLWDDSLSMPGSLQGGMQRNGFLPVRMWQLTIKHKDGNLEEIVLKARRRNLIISFCVLFLLTSAIVLIVTYTRRMRRLADQQMAFVAGVSHDLRTPIAVMHAAGENLKDGLIIDASETRDYGRLIVDESRKLLNTVEQVLSYAGISFGSEEFLNTEFDVNSVIYSAVNQHQKKLDEFTLDIQLQKELPLVKGDPEALHTAINNLLQNAIKYSNGIKCLTVATEWNQSRSTYIRIQVEDRGIGIESVELPHIFEPFYRTKFVRDEQIRGNGLGLSVVKNIIEAHEGRIEVESEPGKGTTFNIYLPVFNGAISSENDAKPA